MYKRLLILCFVITNAQYSYSSSTMASIFKAIEKQDLSAVTQFLQKGGDPNLVDVNGNSLLIVSVCNNDLRMARLLLQSGADVEKCDSDGASPLQCAKTCNMIRLLVDFNANVNRISLNGFTALGFCTTVNEVNCLIKLGADVNVHGPDKVTPLVDVMESGLPNIALVLLENGANPNIVPDAPYHAPLQYATLKNLVEVMKKMLEKGVNVNSLDNTGETPLIMTFMNWSFATADFLLQHGADPNIPNSNNETPLLIAVFSDKVSFVRLLINNGADPFKKGSVGGWSHISPCALAKITGNKEISRLLHSLGRKQKRAR